MAVIQDSGIRGEVHALLVHADNAPGITSHAIDSVSVTFEGFAGESHSGLTRKSCVRVKDQYTEGTVIRNTRQISIVSLEELAFIADLMDVDHIKPEWLGANLCLSGIPDLTLLPPSTRLICSGGVSLVVDAENEPCKYPAEVIEGFNPGKGRFFVKHAFGKRGVTAWVEREGLLTSADAVAVHIPRQRRYHH